MTSQQAQLGAPPQDEYRILRDADLRAREEIAGNRLSLKLFGFRRPPAIEAAPR